MMEMVQQLPFVPKVHRFCRLDRDLRPVTQIEEEAIATGRRDWQIPFVSIVDQEVFLDDTELFESLTVPNED
jgi:hypothetical protein